MLFDLCKSFVYIWTSRDKNKTQIETFLLQKTHRLIMNHLMNVLSSIFIKSWVLRRVHNVDITVTILQVYMCDGGRERICSGRGRIVSSNRNGLVIKLAGYPAIGYTALVLGQIPDIRLVAYPINRISVRMLISKCDIRLDIRSISTLISDSWEW